MPLAIFVEHPLMSHVQTSDGHVIIVAHRRTIISDNKITQVQLLGIKCKKKQTVKNTVLEAKSHV